MHTPIVGDTFYAALNFLDNAVVVMCIEEILETDKKGVVLQFVARMVRPVCEHEYVFPYRRTNKKKDNWMGVATHLTWITN
jgi:hypothetical protein